MKKKTIRASLIVWVLLVLVFVGVFQWSKRTSETDSIPREDYSTFLSLVEEGRVSTVWINGNELTVEGHSPDFELVTYGGIDSELMDRLSDQGALVQYGRRESSTALGRFSGAVPILLVFVAVLAFFIYLSRQQGGSKGLLNLTKSRARRLDESTKKVLFEDVGGAVEAKEALRDVVDFLKHPDRWKSAGVRLPRGVLLVGPPGCGKTLLARAVAGEADVPFFFVSASEFVEMFVGVGAARVRDMFESASKSAPCIVFVDELDAVGRRRGSGIGSAHDEREQTLNQLLVSLDGFAADDRVVVMAATNRPDVLDKALLRPGRFDRQIRIPLPEAEERRRILEIHAKGKPLASEVSLQKISEDAEGLSGADLESLANEAGLLAVRRLRDTEDGTVEISSADFDEALRLLRSREHIFTGLDAILIESASQLAQPPGKTVVRVYLKGDATLEGQLIWADATFIKLKGANGEDPVIVPKSQIVRVQALNGSAVATEIVADRWAHHRTDVV